MQKCKKLVATSLRSLISAFCRIMFNSQFSIFIDIAKLQHRFARFGGCFTMLDGTE